MRKGYQKRRNAFTLVELLIVLALIAILLLISIPYGMDFYYEKVLGDQTSQIANALKNAQSRAKSGKNDSAWGVKFKETEYILFMGKSYDDPGRDDSYDESYDLPSGVETEGVKEVFFDQDTGYPRITPDY